MSVEHLGTVEGLDELMLDTVQVLGVSQANFIYVNDAPHTDFTFDAETQVCPLIMSLIYICTLRSSILRDQKILLIKYEYQIIR